MLAGAEIYSFKNMDLQQVEVVWEPSHNPSC